MGSGISVQPRTGTVSCGPNATVVFTFEVAARGSGTVSFTWRPDDRLTRMGATVRNGSMTFTGTQTQHADYSVALRGTSGQRLQGEMDVEITAPESARGVNGDNFDVTCR
jgi:hypothetical protein